MDKEWFTARELTNIGELRKSEQGINKRARKENWRRRNRLGKQGTAYEYHISSLPPQARRQLQPAAEEPAVYVAKCVNPTTSLQAYLKSMTPGECESVLHFLTQHGVVGLLEIINKNNK